MTRANTGDADGCGARFEVCSLVVVRCAGVYRGDSTSPLSDAQIGPRRQDELRIDQEVALVHVAVGIGPELDLPLGAGIVDLRLHDLV